MAWCLQTISHYLNQCWHSSMSPYGIAGPQWVNRKIVMKLFALMYVTVNYVCIFAHRLLWCWPALTVYWGSLACATTTLPTDLHLQRETGAGCDIHWGVSTGFPACHGVYRTDSWALSSCPRPCIVSCGAAPDRSHAQGGTREGAGDLPLSAGWTGFNRYTR